LKERPPLRRAPPPQPPHTHSQNSLKTVANTLYAPSMSSAPPPLPPPSSPLANLPLETVGRIVELVHEQDKQWQSRDSMTSEKIQRADEDTKENIAKGVFPSAAGRGVVHLSVVNKALRSLCLPHMLKVRTASPSPVACAQPLHADCYRLPTLPPFLPLSSRPFTPLSIHHPR
jgi:hypothetical protein